MISIVPVVCLAIAGLLAGWYKCHDPEKKGFRRITPVGWAFMVVIVAFTLGDAIYTWQSALNASSETRALEEQLSSAHLTINELKDLHVEASKAIAQIGGIQKKDVAIDIWETSVRFQDAIGHHLARSMRSALAEEDPVIRAAQSSGWIGNEASLERTVSAVVTSIDRVKAMLPEGSSGIRYLEASRALHEKRASFVLQARVMTSTARLGQLAILLENVLADCDAAIRLARVEMQLQANGEAIGMEPDQLKQMVEELRKAQWPGRPADSQ